MEDKQKGIFLGESSQTPMFNQVSLDPYGKQPTYNFFSNALPLSQDTSHLLAPSMVPSFTPGHQLSYNMETQAPLNPSVTPFFLPNNSLGPMQFSSSPNIPSGMGNQTQNSMTYQELLQYPVRSNYTFALEKLLNLAIAEPIPDQFGQGQTLDILNPPFYTCSVCYLEFPTAQSLGGHMSCHNKTTRKEKEEAPPIGIPSKKRKYTRSTTVPAKKLSPRREPELSLRSGNATPAPGSSILKTSKTNDQDTCGKDGQGPTYIILPVGENFHADDEVGNKTTPVGEGDVPKEMGCLSEETVTSHFCTLNESFYYK